MRHKNTVFLSLLASLCLSFCLSIPTASANSPRKLRPNDLRTIYRNWFKRPYEYMFERGNAKLEVNGRSYGKYLGGIRGILYYGALNDAVAKFLKKGSQSFGDPKIFARLSGIKVFRKKARRYYEFNQINPAIVHWGIQNLIPNPKDVLWKHTYQTIYDKLFANSFRIFASAYIYLQAKTNVKEELRLYRKYIKARKYSALDHLNTRYNSKFSSYKHKDQSDLSAGMAVGFWLRRYADGTDKILWDGLQELMRRFDETWMNNAIKQGSKP